MNVNPYQAPESKPSTGTADDIPGLVRYRVFHAATFSFVFSGRRQMDKLRAEVRAFTNNHVGAENVISIAEHMGFDYAIAVWYRTTTSTAERNA